MYENQPCSWAMQIQMSYTTNNGATLGFEETLWQATRSFTS
jgi:hypothetical protein